MYYGIYRRSPSPLISGSGAFYYFCLMAKKKPKPRSKKYESKLAVKEGTEWSDLINMSMAPTKEEPKKKGKRK